MTTMPTRSEAELMLRVVAKQHADAGNAWQAASIAAAVDALASQAPAIDLSSIDPEWIKYAALMLRQDSDATDERCAVELDRLLALIDGKVQPKGEFFVVWNSARNEGFVTSDKRDAEWVASGRNRPFATPTVGEAFREAYAEDGICPAEMICLPTKGEGVAHD